MSEHYSGDELDQPFQIIRMARVPDGAGGFSETETTLPSPSTYHLAKVRPLRGQERLTNEGIDAYADLLFVCYAAIEVRPTDVLLYGGVRYNVSSALPPGLSQFREVAATSGGVT